MDILTSLPQAPAPEIASRPSPKDTRDNRVEESGALSFPGLLEKSQDRTPHTPSQSLAEGESPTGEKNATVEGKLTDTATGPKTEQAPAITAGPGAVDRPVMIGQMLRIQMAAVPPTQETAPIISAMAGTESTVATATNESAAQVDIQPTGGDSTPAASIDLSGLKAVKSSPTSQGVQPAATGETRTTPTPVPQAVGQAELLPSAGAMETTTSSADPKAAASVTTEATATMDKMVQDPSVKSSDTVTRTAVASDLSGQIPAKELDKGQDQGHGQVKVNKLQAEAQGPTVQAVPADGSAEGQASLSNTPGQDMAGASEMAATVEKPSDNTGATKVSSVDTKETASVELPEGMLGSQLESTANQHRVSSVGKNVSSRAAALEQGNQIRQQVISQLSSSLGNNAGNQKMTLLLNPESLGQVEIQFTTNRNDLNIVMTASNVEAEHALREGLKELADGIVDKAGRWQQVDIKVDQRGQDQEKNESRQDKNRDQSRRESGQDHGQKKQDRQQDGMPDWASLRQEG